MVIECKKPCKKKKSTMLTVEQMVDIALGTPEIGAVNFNVLHALIHVIIQQLNIKNCLVEFKGYDSDRMEGIILSAKPGPILKLSEYIIDSGEDGKLCAELREKAARERIEREQDGVDGRGYKRAVCECGRRKRSLDEDKEKDRGNDESEAEDRKYSDSKRKKESKTEKETDEYESKKMKDLRNSKESKEDKEIKETSASGELKDNKELKEGNLKKDKKESKEGSEKKDKKDSKDASEKKDKKDSKDASEGAEQKDEKKKCCPCKTVKDSSTLKNASYADENVKAVSSAYYGSETDAPCKTIVRVEPVGEKCDNWRSRPALAHESIVKLEEKVAMLQDAFEALEKMPTNEELKQRTESGTPSTPVKDLWQTYNLHKRVESCEGTIEKLASMIEDIVKETCKFKEAVLVIADAVDDMDYTDASARRECCAALEGRPKTSIPTTSKQGASEPVVQHPVSSQFTLNAARNASNYTTSVDPNSSRVSAGIEGQRANRPSSVTFQNQESGEIGPSKPSSVSQIDKKDSKPSKSIMPSPESTSKTADAPGKSSVDAQDSLMIKSSQAAMQSVGDNVPVKPEEAAYSGKSSMQESLPCSRVSTGSGAPPVIGPEYCKMTPHQKFCALKDNVDWLNCQIRGLTDNLPITQIGAKLCALVSLQKQLDALEKEWRNFLESLNGGEGTGPVNSAFATMRSDSQNMSSLISKLIADKQEMEATVKNILLEIQILKNVKADMEIVEDLLAEKADASAVNRKVSHDQFDAACDDLTRGLDGALDLLMKQEDIWRETVEELYKDMEGKLNKNEIMPLKEFINKKLKCLQEKLKQLAQLRKDAEAAGAKSRILRNLNCIACDGDVVMKMDNTMSFQCPVLPPAKSIKPMITYELDQVRKAMKKGPCKPSSHVDEVALEMQKKAAGIPLTQREVVDNKLSRMAHFCNRYCGGSHTITTAAQRVTRIGHFLTEFGPQALAMFDQTNCESKQNFGQSIEVNYEKSYR